MPPIPLPFTDATLRLALPFSGVSLALRIFLTLALLGVFVGLLALLYRHELKLIPPRFARALFLLRALLVAALFLTVVTDPILARTVKEEVPGRVLIAVDRSDSMRVTDPNRPIAEKLRIAKRLKLVADLASEGQLDGWIKQAESNGRVSFSAFGGADEVQRFERVLKRLNETPRVQLAARVLSADGLRLVDALKEKHAVDLVAFGADLGALPPEADKMLAALTPPPGKALFTDLKHPLARAAESVADGPDATGPKLLGVVLLTDGRHNWGEPPGARARELAQLEVPVFSIVVAPDEAPADVALVSAQAQAATVFKGSVVPVEAQVRVTGWPVGKLKVTMTLPPGPDGAKPEPATEIIDHAGKDATYPVTFKAKMDVPGPHVMIVTVEAGEADRFPENNARAARVNVVKDRAKVMLIDGEARWEFHYLHTCLGRDPNMDVRSIVFRQPRIGAVKGDDELRKLGLPAKVLPDDPDALSAYDCVILGDVEPTQLTLADRVRFEKYVAEAGGTLVMIAGKRAMPVAYGAGDDEPFRKLLPIKNPKAFVTDDGFPIGILPEGQKSWFLAMGDSAVSSQAAWDRFPLHSFCVIGEPKDGADVLAVVPGGAGKERALIARQSYGFGRVLYVGIDSTWRWRFKAGDYFHHRFWGQVAQWAASDRLLPVTNAAGTIRFGTREPAYTGGQDVEVVARAAEAVKKLTSAALKGARVVRLPDKVGDPEKSVALVPLAQPDGRPRDLVGRAKDLPPGKYAVELEVPEWADQLDGPPGTDGRATKLRCPFEVLPPDNEELVDLAANRPLLDDLAAAGGGKVYSLDAAHELIEALAARTATREYAIERPMRRTWALLALFLVLLSVEWAVRKWAGLP